MDQWEGYNQPVIPSPGGPPRNLVIPLVITESGVDGLQPVGWKNHYDAEECLDQLRWWDNVLKQDSFVLGVTLFSLEVPGWDSFDLTPIVPQLV